MNKRNRARLLHRSLLAIFILLIQVHLSLGSADDDADDDWSSWSSWSPCSRTCGGGITQQTRRCKSPGGCHGVSTRRKICDIQPCTDLRNMRIEQCNLLNEKIYDGFIRTWEVVYDVDNPCSPTCKAIGTDIIAKLSPLIMDGALCSSGADSLHVCLDGSCEPVSCDMEVGAIQKKYDECGVCGGDNSSCASHRFEWESIPLEPCNMSCDGGHRAHEVLCRNTLTAEKVEDSLCNLAEKPQSLEPNCNQHPCKPEWKTDEWDTCSVLCGGGIQFRNISCIHRNNYSQTLIPEKYCSGMEKPGNQKPCNMKLCSHWHSGPWSECSITCGSGGIKTRNVVCRDGRNLPSSTCNLADTPSRMKVCEDNFPCPQNQNSVNTVFQIPTTLTLKNDLFESKFEAEYLDDEAPFALPLKYIPFNSVDVDMRDESPSLYGPTFVVESWGPCNKHCGDGVRYREVNCKIFLEFTRTVARIPDKECPGPKPPLSEPCFIRPCQVKGGKKSGQESLSDSDNAALADSDVSNYRKTVGAGLPPGISMNDMSFSWKVDGYTECSAKCLGGVQERRITCVRDYDQRVATPVLCMDKQPPPDIPITQSCNDHPCPPRWNVSDFGPCSKPCGGGVMSRMVTCLHEVTQGNVVAVPNHQCDQPVPRTEKFCNAVDCPPFWEAGEWDRCSEACGGGLRRRQLFCKQIIALGQIVDRVPAEAFCSLSSQPNATKVCNHKPCGGREKGIQNGGSHLNGNHSQNIVQREWKKVLSLPLRGEATVFKGIALKLKCPTQKGVDRKSVFWRKNWHFTNLESNTKFEIIHRSGILKIRNTSFSDSGVYTCLVHDQPISNMTINVVLYPGDAESVDLRNQQRNNNNERKRSSKPKGFSHESKLFADQQLFSKPVNDGRGNNGLESQLLTPNTRIFSASSATLLDFRINILFYFFQIFLIIASVSS